jgi:predicted branched-subunit amino acid permease
LLVIVPFAMLFGVVATEAGMNLAQTMGFSVLVIAGAAQFTAIQLITENAPTLVVIASALAVNMRMAMYSASLAPHIGGLPLNLRAVAAYFLFDQTYAVALARYESGTKLSLAERFAYFLGAATPISSFWCASTYVGAVVGAQIPPEYALDFALPITFLALIAPALRTPAHVVAAGTAVVVSLLLAGLPYSLGVIVAACCGIFVGAQVELFLTRSEQ